jgi:hypothetical protein
METACVGIEVVMRESSSPAVILTAGAFVLHFIHARSISISRVVFEMTPLDNVHWSYTVLQAFANSVQISSKAINPAGSVCSYGVAYFTARPLFRGSNAASQFLITPF